MKFYFLLIILLLLQNYLFSQEIKVIKNVSGEYIIANKSDISLKTGFEKAVAEAKFNALRQAGVVENISSTDILSSSEKSGGIKQDINSILSVEISGAVYNDSIISETTYVNKFGNTVIKVVLNVNVIKYDKKQDPSFDFKIEGLKEYYENNDLMKFSFTPYSDGYLTIFATNEKENFVLYPNNNLEYKQLRDSLNVRFRANQRYDFPRNKFIGSNKEVGYILSTENERQYNSLIFIYTKEIFPFSAIISRKNIITWIYSISPDMRKILYKDFVIVSKK